MEQLGVRRGLEQPPIAPWDYRYWGEKVRKAGKYDLDETEVKPYLQLSRMLKACSWPPANCSGWTFEQVRTTCRSTIPDVTVYEATRNGQRVGIWCSTSIPTPAPASRPAPAMNEYRTQERLERDRRPRRSISNNENFIPPKPRAQPCLIS